MKLNCEKHLREEERHRFEEEKKMFNHEISVYKDAERQWRSICFERQIKEGLDKI